MTVLTRRNFTAVAGASLATSLFAPAAFGQAKPRLVVIGGGPGGATVARYVAKDSNGAVDVTLIEPQKTFTTCFFSNIYVGGFRDLKSLTHTYDNVAKAGVKVVHAAATAIDRDKKVVTLGRRRHRALRPPGDRARHRPQIQLGARLFGSRRRDHAARLEGGAADRTSGEEAQRAQRRRPHRDGGAAEPLPLPAGPLRARVDVRPCAQDQGPQEVEDHHRRSEARLLQAGGVHGRLGEALSRHDRMAGSQGAWRHQGRRSEDRRGENRPGGLQGGAGQRHPGADGRQDRDRRRASPTSPASARSIRSR